MTIFNYSPKKRIRVKTGHRQNYTRLLVEQLGGGELEKRKSAEPKQKAAKRPEKVVAIEAKADLPAKVSPRKSATEKPVAKKPATTQKKPVSKSTAQKPKAATKKTVKPAPKPAAKKTEPKKK